MLRYIDFGLSYMEVPGEASICIYITGCPNQCPDCHYPELQSKDTGELLNENIEIILSFYSHIASCVCFLGEGEAGDTERNELLNYTEKAHGRGLKCWLALRDEIKVWLRDAPAEQKDEFIKSGATECLAMICVRL